MSESLFKLVKTEISSSNYKSFNFNLFLKYALKQDAMEPSSSSEESIRFIVTYVTVAKHPMPAMLNARRVILLCGLFGAHRSHDRCTPFIAETNRPINKKKNVMTRFWNNSLNQTLL